MGSSIKQKEKTSANPDDDVFVYPLMKPRSQELADRRRQQSNPIPSDLAFMSNKMSFVNEVDHPQSSDKQTVSSKELQDMNETRNRLLYRNDKSGRSISWY